MAPDHAVLVARWGAALLTAQGRRVIVNYHPNDVVLVPSVLTPPAVIVSSEADTYLGLLIIAIFWAFFSGAVVAVSEHDASSQKSAARWAASFVVASLVGAYLLWMLSWGTPAAGITCYLAAYTMTSPAAK
jgi:hypothetical protein